MAASLLTFVTHLCMQIPKRPEDQQIQLANSFINTYTYYCYNQYYMRAEILRIKLFHNLIFEVMQLDISIKTHTIIVY